MRLSVCRSIDRDRHVNDARPIAETDLSALYDLFHARLLLLLRHERPIKVDDKYGWHEGNTLYECGPWQFMQLTDMHKMAERERERYDN